MIYYYNHSIKSPSGRIIESFFTTLSALPYKPEYFQDPALFPGNGHVFFHMAGGQIRYWVDQAKRHPDYYFVLLSSADCEQDERWPPRLKCWTSPITKHLITDPVFTNFVNALRENF